jgi:hypothetical protein
MSEKLVHSHHQDIMGSAAYIHVASEDVARNILG